MNVLDSFINDGKPTLTVEFVTQVESEGRVVRLNNRRIGVIANTVFGKLYITRRDPRDLFRKYNSWGITFEVLKTLKANNVEKIIIISQTTKRIEAWASNLEDWFIEGKDYWWRDGKELQKHLPLEKQHMLPHLGETLV